MKIHCLTVADTLNSLNSGLTGLDESEATPWGNSLSGTAPLPLSVWIFILLFALGMTAMEELLKWILREFEVSSD